MSNVAPRITKVQSGSGAIGVVIDVTISGSNLYVYGSTLVYFGDAFFTPLLTSTPDKLHIQVIGQATDTVSVRVRTPYGTSGAPFSFLFGNAGPGPGPIDIDPAKGPTTGGNLVSINGSNFLTANTVKFGSKPAKSFAILSDTQIKAIVPAASDKGPVDVTVTNVTSTSRPTTYFYSTLPLPTVLSLSPNYGPNSGGNTVVVTGFGFTYAYRVSFGPNPAPRFTIHSDTSITAIAPPGSGDVTVTVSGAVGQGTVGAPYSYSSTPPTPSITALIPSSGPVCGGNTVIVNGTNFNAVTVLTVNGQMIPFTRISDTVIAFTAPAAATPGPVNVIVLAGTTASAPATYTYVGGGPAPVSISPNTGPVTGGTLVTITGTGLTGTSSVTFGTTPATGISVINDTTVTLTTPAHAVGVVPVTITTTGGTNSSLTFTYQLAPVITSISPSNGPEAGNTTVIINGTSFLNVTNVNFENVPALSFNVVADSLIVAVSPPGTGLVAITVNKPASTSNGAIFQYFSIPIITSLTPTSGSSSGGNNVTIKGSEFLGTHTVAFGGLPTTFTVLDDNTISAIAPPTGVPGPVSVTVQSPGGTSLGETYTYV